MNQQKWFVPTAYFGVKEKPARLMSNRKQFIKVLIM